jgi:carboxymethylenebutenolidase
MRQTLFALLLVGAFAPAALGGTTVTFDSSPGHGQGYLALPEGKGKHAALVVIPEWWGLNDWVKEQADNYAKQGYVVLAADLYRGKVAKDPAEAHELMRGMPEDRANADVGGAFNWLAKRNDVDVKHIGVIGWCMGGGYALGLATTQPKLAAAVINYGHLVTDPKTIARIKAPILGNFGAADRGIPPADVKEFADALVKLNKAVDIKVYEGAGHAFMNPNNKEGYKPDAAADAQKRIDAFLQAKLHK